MKATIVNFRMARHHQKTNHILIEVEGVSSREEAEKLVGKEVVWKTPGGKIIKGKIVATHGNKGVVRAIFEKGLPGQALGTKVEILN